MNKPKSTPSFPNLTVQFSLVTVLLILLFFVPVVSVGDSRKISVVTTVGMLSDIVVQIGGEDIRVTGIMGPGIDPHLYKPNRDDVQILMNADLIFYVGHHLEGRMGDALAKLKARKRVVPLGERLPDAYLLRATEIGDEVDPHLWMDVGLWSQLIEIVVGELSLEMPAQAEAFKERGARYREDLMEVDRALRISIQSIPEQKRVLVTSHDAFRYFGRAYGMQVLGIQGISTESEAGAGGIIKLVDLLVERKIPSIFVESTVAKKNIEALVEGGAARKHPITIGGELFSDAMGAAGTEVGTYKGMMLSNGIKIAESLGGDVRSLLHLCRTYGCKN